jgi:superfamily II DNA or RNA helicase
MNCFSNGYHSLRLFVENDGKPGLYKNQIAALGATLAHFSTKSEPALIAMPTGTGKTAVMIVLSYAFKAKKVLVITPSMLVREQITKQFKDPKLLIDNGIISGENILPRVYELASIENDAIRWQEIIRDHDVVVGIPGTISQIQNIETTIGRDSFDFVFIDEAHHSRADSWMNILKTFSSAKQILLTATPFRRDKKDIRARLVYNYPLKQAFEDGLFSKISLVTVDTSLDGTDEDKNIRIAKKAEDIYENRNHADHKIIIRTDRRTNADNLLGLYRSHTKLNLEVVHSRLSERTVRSRIRKLTSGELDGIICVDMMGEGYDFPSLKIAAVHIPHKSLAITLQFVGRISRTNTEEGNLATVIAGEHEFKIESHQLYKNDTHDWSIVLPDLHKAKIQKTEEEQEFFDSFNEQTTPRAVPATTTAEGDLTIEDDDLRPFFHTKVYQVIKQSFHEEDEVVDITKEIEFSGTDALNNPIIRHHHVSTSYDVSVHVVSELKKPAWYLGDEELSDVKNELFVVYFDRDNSMLFISATLKDNELYEHIASQYIQEDVGTHEMIPLPILKRLMAGWVEPKMYNVGMKSRKTKGNSEAYKNILGSLAQKGVLPSDKYNYTRGHSFGGGFDPILGKQVLAGISTSSKVWSLEDNKIKYLVEWFKYIARKVGDPEMDKRPSPLSELDSGKVVNVFPDFVPFFADWDSQLYHKSTRVVFIDADDEVAESALLCSCTIEIINYSGNEITMQISKGAIASKLKYVIEPRISFHCADDTEYRLAIRKGQKFGSPEHLLSILNENPINIFYENLAKLVGKVYFEYAGSINTITDAQIQPHGWPQTVNITKEYYTEADVELNSANGDSRSSIHEYVIELARREFDVVFYDHGSLEIADVIGISAQKVQFYHCKKQDGDSPRVSVDDIYEVAGQAVKSGNWAHRKLLIKQLYDRADQNDTSTRLKKGTLAEIKNILDTYDNPIIPVVITIVQPGLKTSNLNAQQESAFARVKTLLSGADTFLQDISQCKLHVLCS